MQIGKTVTSTDLGKSEQLGNSPLNFLWVELTQRCNLECSHCYSESNHTLPVNQTMTLSDWKDLLDEARACKCGAVQFIGGEPFLFPQIDELIDHAILLEFDYVEIFTNGTTVNTNTIKSLRKNRVRLATTVYSFDACTHDAITGIAGSWEQTVSGLRMLLENDIQLRVQVVQMPANASDVPKTTEFLHGLGIANVGVDDSRTVGRGKSMKKNTGLCGACGDRKLCVTNTGDVYPCIMARDLVLGNVLDGTLMQCLSSLELRGFRQELKSQDCADSTNCGPGDCGPNYCGPYRN